MYMYIYIYIYIYICVCVCVCVCVLVCVCVCVCVCSVCMYTWEDPKLPGIVKKNYLKYLYMFETLVPFEVPPLRLDAAIPAPLPMRETLSKIFDGNAVTGRQRFTGGP